MVKNIVGKLKLVLPFIGIGILAYIIYTLDPQEIVTAFLSIDPLFVMYSLLLTIPLLFIRNIEYQLILHEQKIILRPLDSLKIYLIGIFYGSFTPGYSGQLMRVPYLKEKTGEPFGKLFVNTIIDTFVHSFSIYGMIIIGAFLVVGTIPELLPVTVVWMVGFCLAVLYFSGKREAKNSSESLSPILSRKKSNHI